MAVVVLIDVSECYVALSMFFCAACWMYCM